MSNIAFNECYADDEDLSYIPEYEKDDSFVVCPSNYLKPSFHKQNECERLIGCDKRSEQSIPQTNAKASHHKKSNNDSVDIRLTHGLVETEFARMAAARNCNCKDGYCLRQPDGKQESLLTGVIEKSMEVIKWCRRSIATLSQREKYNFVHGKFLESIKQSGIKRSLPSTAEVRDPYDKFTHRFVIGDRSAGFPEMIVCRQAFMQAYGITTWMMDTISRHVKAGRTHDCPEISDKTRTKDITLAEIRKIAAKHGLKMSTRQGQAAIIPNTRQSLFCYFWMETYFNQFGDHIPNSNGQIHLDFIEKTVLHDEYCRDLSHTYPDTAVVSYPRFCEMWKAYFPHVSIRRHKGVTGKCSSCALMTGLRYSCTDPKRRQLLVELHALHRSMFMNERLSYYERIHHALSHPDTIMSCISDGMAQQHCILPHMAGISQFATPLSQHLQGVLEHGQLLTIYRTFHTVSNGSNLQIYCLLSQIERWYARYGRFPEIIYWQVDGGSENANKFLLAMCELLVNLDIGIKKILYTRLPVGHTHEDIDSKFAKIWVALRCRSVYTPQDYKTKLEETFASSRIKCEVIDVFAIPDYASWLQGHIDPEFGKCHKTYHTQHQWQFERVNQCADFPMSVKTRFKTFAADSAYEIVVSTFPHENECGRLLGLKAIETETFWGPVGNLRRADGMYILESYPTDKLGPKELNVESRASLEKTLREVRKEFGESSPVYKAWVEWSKSEAPLTDDVYDYLKASGGIRRLHRPLNDFFDCGRKSQRILSPLEVQPQVIDCESKAVSGQRIPRFRQGNSVGWKGQEKVEEPRVRVDDEAVEDCISRYRDYAEFVIDYDRKDITVAQISNSLKLRNLPHSGDKKMIGNRLADSDVEELFVRFRPLLPDKQLGVNWVLHHSGQAEHFNSIIVEYVYTNEQGICTNSRPVLGKDVLLLKWERDPGDDTTCLWLNDNVINYFFAEYDLRDKANQRSASRKPTKFFDSHFMTRIMMGGVYSYTEVRRWTKRQNLSLCDKVMIPINISNQHWALLVLRMTSKTISYYDSMGGDGSKYFDILLQYLEDESKGEAGLGKDAWVFKRRQWKCTNCKTPQQSNGYDCGVFCILIADLISLDIPLLFGQADIVAVRRRLVASIFDRLSDPNDVNICTVVGEICDLDDES